MWLGCPVQDREYCRPHYLSWSQRLRFSSNYGVPSPAPHLAWHYPWAPGGYSFHKTNVSVVCSVMPPIPGGRPSSCHHKSRWNLRWKWSFCLTLPILPALALEIEWGLKLFRCLCFPGPRDWSGFLIWSEMDQAVLPWIIVSVDGQCLSVAWACKDMSWRY